MINPTEKVLKKVSLTKIKIGILTGCLFMSSNIAIAPALADISASFPNVSVSIIQMLITISQLMTVPFSLLAGRLASTFTKKTIIMFSIGAVFFGGCIPLIVSSNIVFLIIASCFIGIGMGALIPATSALICEYFDGEERGSLMGIQAAVVNSGAMIFSILGGQFSRIGWKFAYGSYLITLPAILAVALLLPRGRIEEKINKADNNNIGINVFYLAVIGFLLCIFINTYNTNISLYVAEQKLGSTVQASTASTFSTLGGILAGITLKKTLSVFNKYIISFSVVMAAIGLGLISIAGNLSVICVGGFLVGFALGIFAPSLSFLVSEYLTEQNLSIGIAIVFAFCNFGNALSPVIVNQINSVFDGGVKEKFMISAIAMMAIFLITVIKTKYEQKSYKEELS
ncbi:MFS transporter [Clostridium sp. SYSU_GA19001]|uniref:MFS transporter n=1 Tax=Clostridium caldaquaticum TaxID=2940653 RepID=UPI0020779BEC|nr:MFS transporter [Clostridium caldaquaticum]MCM8709916.1 MFS transporter [Clostridium caldaquaticum]